MKIRTVVMSVGSVGLFYLINLISVMMQGVELFNHPVAHFTLTVFFALQIIGVFVQGVGGLMGFLVSILWFINLF